MSKNNKKNNKIEEIDEKEEEYEEENEEIEENSFISSVNIKNENNSNKKIFIIHLLIYSEIITNKGEDASNCICRNFINKDKPNETFFENEIIPHLELPIYINNNKKKLHENDVDINNINNENNLNNQNENDNYQIKLFDLCKNLKILGFPITGSMINVYNFMLNDYILYGCDPIDHNIYINNKNNILNDKIIKIKLINFIDKKLISGNINRNEELKELDEDDEDYSENSDISEIKIINNKDNNNNNNNNTKTKRRERRIGYVVEKVLAWRRLYNGFYNENGEHTKYDLEKAAKILGISKKSLDDYLLQIRLGRKYGFDFNNNRNNRVGVLRIFVRKKKDEEEKLKKNNNINQN